MPSISAHLLKAYARWHIKIRPSSADELVGHLRRHFNTHALPVLPAPGIVRGHRRVAGIGVDTLSPAQPRAAVLYVHGGGYVAGITRTYFNMCSLWARRLQLDIWLPDYRLAPEHPYPAALDDVRSVYLDMLQHYAPSNIVLAGDSAGGALVLSLLLRLRDEGQPLPAAALALSPYADLSNSMNSRIRCDARDDMLSLDMLHSGRDIYLAGADPRQPYASPAFGDYQQLPPLWLSCSQDECLADDAQEVARRARQAGVSVELLERPQLPHVWPIFYPFIHEARQDQEAILDFLRHHLH